MLGYTFETEIEAIAARDACAEYKGLPIEGNTSRYWVNYNYSNEDEFYYIQYDEGVEVVLGEPEEFELTIDENII